MNENLDLLAHEARPPPRTCSASSGASSIRSACVYPLTASRSSWGPIPGEGEHPAPEAVLDLLYESMSAMRDGTRAVAFTAPVETPEGDAVRVELDHRDGGPALALLLPYRRRRLRRAVETGDLVATPGERRVWS